MAANIGLHPLENLKQGSIHWGGGAAGGETSRSKKVFPEKKLKAISNTDLT